MPYAKKTSRAKIESARNASRVAAEARAQQAEALFASVADAPRDYQQRKLSKALWTLSCLQKDVKNLGTRLARSVKIIKELKRSSSELQAAVLERDMHIALLNNNLNLLMSNHALLRTQFIEIEAIHLNDVQQLAQLDNLERNLTRAQDLHSLDRTRIRTLSHEIDKYRARERRSAFANAMPLSPSRALTQIQLKPKGIISDIARIKILELTKERVGTEHIFPIFRIMAPFFKARLNGSFGSTSVRRVIAEGSIAGHMELADAMSMARCKLARLASFFCLKSTIQLSLFQVMERLTRAPISSRTISLQCLAIK
jgi:hypothetical protein